MRENPNDRLLRMTQKERILWSQDIYPGGVDEAGRGPLAGPVVAACVIMPKMPLLPQVNDSKKVTPKRRDALYDAILNICLSHGIAEAGVEEIERLNIRGATRLAMCRAIEQCRAKVAFVDAERDLETAAEQTAIVRGDQVSYVIAAASILAKVYRDRLMLELDRQYPAYGFAAHKGYGTAEHIQALRAHGPCPEHRRLFVRNFI